MNFEDAIRAHSAWKQKLTAYLNKPDQSLNVAVVGADNQCELGRWLKLNCARPEYRELDALHTQFHREAGALVRRANTGEKVSAEAGLGAISPYGQVSTKLVLLLRDLKTRSV